MNNRMNNRLKNAFFRLFLSGCITTTAVLLMLMTAGVLAAEQTQREVSFMYGTVKLRLVAQDYGALAHQVTPCGEQSICLIDGKPFFGTDLKLPRLVLTTMQVEIRGAKIDLDTSGMFDPWVVYEGRDFIEKERFSVLHTWNNSWVVRGTFSDGAGTYMAEWIVVEGHSMRTLLKDAEDLSVFCLDMFK